MINPNVLDSLLNSSFDDELPEIPILTQRRFPKKISKEQIKGWNTHQGMNPFEGLRMEKEITKQLTNNNKKLMKAEKKRAGEQWHHSRPRENKEEKHQSTPVISLFNTFEELPSIFQKKPVQIGVENAEDTLDYVKGKKIECPLHPKSNLISKQLFSTFDSSKRRLVSARSLPHEGLEKSGKTMKMKSSQEQEGSYNMISYPIGDLHLYHRPQRQEVSVRAKLQTYMKKYHI